MTETQPERRSGERRVPRSFLPGTAEEQQYAEHHNRIAAERGRWELTLGSIRAHLEEQPSPAAIHAAGRRWINAVLQITEQTAADKRGQHTKERDQ